MFTEWEEGFCMGLALGQKLPTMRRQPTSIPVERIQASPESLRMRPGDIVYIYFDVYPSNATIQAVDCTTSDIEVVAINRLDDLTFQVIAIEAGSASIQVRATDGYGATQTVNVAVLDDVMMENLSLQTFYNNFGDMLTAESLLVFNYTPIEAPGKNLRVTLEPSLSGNQTPLKVEDTPFDNIKKITNTFDSFNLDDYKSKASGMGWKAEATDGSGLQILNRVISTGDLEKCIYGDARTKEISMNMELVVGYKKHLFDSYALVQNLAVGNNMISIEVEEGDNLISIDQQLIVDGLSVGVSKVKVIIGNYRTYNITITLKAEPSTNLSPTMVLVDEQGQQADAAYSGYYTLTGTTYRVIPYKGTGGKILSITPEDASKIEVNGEWVTPKAAGSIALRVEYEYKTTSGTQTGNSRIVFSVYSSGVICGTATSDYLKSGVAVWVGTKGNPSKYNVRNHNVVDIIYNGNEARQTGFIKVNTSQIATITFNKDGASGASPTNMYATVYVFEKLTSGPVKIRFQQHDFPDIFDEVEI